MRAKVILAMFLIVLCCAGCSFSRGGEDDTEDKNQIEYVNSIENLTSGEFYVYHEGKYLKPYIGNTSYDKNQKVTKPIKKKR